MKCVWSNLCGRKYLCCNFCTIKKCNSRCTDDHTKCKFFFDLPCDPNNAEETNDPPIKMTPQKQKETKKWNKKRADK